MQSTTLGHIVKNSTSVDLVVNFSKCQMASKDLSNGVLINNAHKHDGHPSLTDNLLSVGILSNFIFIILHFAVILHQQINAETNKNRFVSFNNLFLEI